jgi:hypothetical protein
MTAPTLEEMARGWLEARRLTTCQEHVESLSALLSSVRSAALREAAEKTRAAVRLTVCSSDAELMGALADRILSLLPPAESTKEPAR